MCEFENTQRKIEVKEKTCSNENIFERKLKIISNEDKYLQFLFIYQLYLKLLNSVVFLNPDK